MKPKVSKCLLCGHPKEPAKPESTAEPKKAQSDIQDPKVPADTKNVSSKRARKPLSWKQRITLIRKVSKYMKTILKWAVIVVAFCFVVTKAPTLPGKVVNATADAITWAVSAAQDAAKEAETSEPVQDARKQLKIRAGEI